jgi:anhydro-N-acetylmuramic acid kinase
VSRALLNIGGIANLTFLPKGCQAKDVVAFDTGPGNMVVDQLMKIFFAKDFDENGVVASSGTMKSEILEYLIVDEFITGPPPKSTGRERYGKEYVETILTRCRNYSREDIVATMTEFTTAAVHENFERFLSSKGKLDELYVSGGGAHNRFMMGSLKRHFAGTDVKNAETLGISSDAKEAICFAVLANETISGNPTNLPQVTGASRATLLGKICLP